MADTTKPNDKHVPVERSVLFEYSPLANEKCQRGIKSVENFFNSIEQSEKS